jgi:hypothetical protein
MATNDGYSPYPIGLTAAEATAAIKRAFNLDTELLGYVRYSVSATPPTILNSKHGDLWMNTSADKLYRAYVGVDNGMPVLLWFEV